MTHIDYQVNQGKKNKGGGQWTRYKKTLTEYSYSQTQQVYHSTIIITRFTGITTSMCSTSASAQLY